MTKSLDAQLYKVAQKLKRLEEQERQGLDGERREYLEEQYSREFVKLQKRYYKQNGFNWNPLMYTGSKLRRDINV